MSKRYTTNATKSFVKATDEMLHTGRRYKGKRITTARELCEILGISPTTYIHIRTGKRNATIEQLATLCVNFGYDLHELVIGPTLKQTTADKKLEKIRNIILE